MVSRKGAVKTDVKKKGPLDILDGWYVVPGSPRKLFSSETMLFAYVKSGKVVDARTLYQDEDDDGNLLGFDSDPNWTPQCGSDGIQDVRYYEALWSISITKLLAEEHRDDWADEFQVWM